MCKMNILHVACKVGSEDGKNFPTNDYEFVMNVFARQFEDERARAAYCCNFLAEMGKRISPANILPVRFAMH